MEYATVHPHKIIVIRTLLVLTTNVTYQQIKQTKTNFQKKKKSLLYYHMYNKFRNLKSMDI